MTINEADPAGDDRNKEFTLPNIDAVKEANWQEMSAQGVRVVDECLTTERSMRVALKFAQAMWGTQNVLTGDAFDEKEQRPLHLKPGRGVYIRAEGLAYHETIVKPRHRRTDH